MKREKEKKRNSRGILSKEKIHAKPCFFSHQYHQRQKDQAAIYTLGEQKRQKLEKKGRCIRKEFTIIIIVC